MNRCIVVYLLLLLTAPASPLLAQRGVWSAGLEGGPGLSLIYGSESVYSHSAPVLSGAAGIFGEYGFAPAFSAKLALHYERISTLVDNHSALLLSGGKLRYNLDCLSLPVLVKWSSGGRIRFFANAGPCVSLLLQESLWYLPENGSKEKVANETGAYHPVNLAITAGIGMAVPIGKKLLVSLELRDNYGLLNIRSGQSDFERNSYFLTATSKGYTNSTLLLAGICYRFGGNKGLPCTPNDPDFQYLRK
ncbi:MAG: porin family protein [Bacteroidetes bacterium]|nr:porin family protein [Bacteroidota bacterium]